MQIKRLFSTAVLCVFIINVNAQLSFQQNNLQEVEKTEISAKVNKTKIPWIKNTGQQQSEVAFYAETFSGTVFVTNTGKIVYSLPIDSTTSYILCESFIKTTDVFKKSDVSGELPSQTKVNYFTGNNSDNWQNNISTFKTVNFGKVWDGIEVKLNAYGNNIEKLFYISPNVNYNNIQLKLQGAKGLKTSKNGELIIKTPEGNIKFTKPVAYQIIENKKQYVEVAYTTKGKTYGFELGKYNPDYELVIDPLIASTFVGGSNSDRIYSIVLDDSNNVYITGGVYSSDYPVTASSYDPTYNGKWEVFVSKFTPDLSELTASTFMGGGEFDVGLAMTLDTLGNVYVTGYAHSGFPVTSSAYDETNNGAEDVFVAKLSSDLSTLQASTFIGGLSTEYGYSIAIDGSGNVLVTGCTYSSGYPTAGTPYNDDPSGGADIYISKFNSDLSTLIASTYIGSSDDDYAYSIVLDGSDNVFITGFTLANNYPTAGTPYDNTHNGSYDAIISKFTPDLSTLTASTYLGGSSDEWGHSIIFDASGDLLITGFTYSSDFPTAGSPYDDSHNGGADVFITKINSDLSTLSASTFIGGSLSEEGHCIAIDDSGNIFVSGHTRSSDYPTTGSPYDDSFNGGAKDINVSKLSSDLSTLLASTFIGGNDDENSNFLAVDNSGNIFVSGYTESSNYPTTSSSFDDSHNGGEDAIISKFDNNLSSLPVITSQPTNQSICEGNNAIFSITATGADSYQWQENTGSGFENITDGDIYNGTQTDTLIITSATANMNTYEYQCVVANSCGNITSNIAILTVYQFVSITSQPKNQAVCEGNDTIFSITATGADSYQWQENTGSGFVNITDGDIYSGAETDTLIITSATANMNTYEYQCVAGNSCGNITSNIAILTVYQFVSIISQPISQEIQEDSNVVFAIIANGDITAYQWRKDEIPLSDTENTNGTITKELTISNVSQNDAGNYDCVITGECNEAITNLVSLTVLTSIDAIQNADYIEIYPNPTNGIFTIEGKNIQAVEITNISGQTIKQLSIDNKKSSIINLKGQAKGVYFLKIQTNNQILTNKIILN